MSFADSAAAVLAVAGVLSFAAALLVALVTTRRRSEVLVLFQAANGELRAELADARSKLETLREQNVAQAVEVAHLRELVTQRAAVAELGGYLAENRRSATDEHRALLDALENIANLLGDRRGPPLTPAPARQRRAAAPAA